MVILVELIYWIVIEFGFGVGEFGIELILLLGCGNDDCVLVGLGGGVRFLENCLRIVG